MDEYVLMSWWESFLKKVSMIGLKRILIFFGTIALTFILFFSFRLYQEYRATKAVEFYVELLERHINLVGEVNEAPLDELAKDIASGKKKLSNSLFYSHASILEILALQRINVPTADMINAFEKALNSLNKNSEMFKIYNLAYALLLLQTKEPTFVERGKNILNEQVKSPNKLISAQSMFFYGWFLLLNESLEEADKIWNNLINNPAFSQSPYFELAKKARNWELS